MPARRKPAKPPPRAAELICPGLDFQVAHEARLQRLPLDAQPGGGLRQALHDLAAPSIVVTEAGGRFTDLDGTAGPAGGSALATNGLLHDDVLARLAP